MIITPEIVKAVQEDRCGGCGCQTYEPCQRHPTRDCYREFHGGKREATPVPSVLTREQIVDRLESLIISYSGSRDPLSYRDVSSRGGDVEVVRARDEGRDDILDEINSILKETK